MDKKAEYDSLLRLARFLDPKLETNVKKLIDRGLAPEFISIYLDECLQDSRNKLNLKQLLDRAVRKYCDYDYLKKLSKAELEYLYNFSKSHYNGKKDRRAPADVNSANYLRQNSCRRDVYSATDSYEFDDNISPNKLDRNYVEDTLIDIIDLKQTIEDIEGDFH